MANSAGETILTSEGKRRLNAAGKLACDCCEYGLCLCEGMIVPGDPRPTMTVTIAGTVNPAICTPNPGGGGGSVKFTDPTFDRTLVYGPTNWTNSNPGCPGGTAATTSVPASGSTTTTVASYGSDDCTGDPATGQAQMLFFIVCDCGGEWTFLAALGDVVYFTATGTINCDTGVVTMTVGPPVGGLSTTIGTTGGTVVITFS